MRTLGKLLATALAVGGLSLSTLSPAQGHQYDGIAIIHPYQEDTVHDNEGHFVVRVEVLPGLVEGDDIVVLLDGEEIARAPSTVFAFKGVDRGPHEVAVQVVDQGGNALAESEPVTFYMWRASAKFPQRLRQ